jgi:hypothetical protein
MSIVAPSCLPSNQRVYSLVDAHFSVVHPLLPVIYKDDFVRDLQSALDARSLGDAEWETYVLSPPNRIFLLVLFAVLALASVYLEGANPPAPEGAPSSGLSSNALAGVVTRLLQEASHAHFFDRSSKLARCQAFLLLGYREFGKGFIGSSWT